MLEFMQSKAQTSLCSLESVPELMMNGRCVG
jgi:hypothetical protein